MDTEGRRAYRERLRSEAEALISDPAVIAAVEVSAQRLIDEGVAPVEDVDLISAAILSVVGDAARDVVTEALQAMHDDGAAWSRIASALGVARTTVYSTYVEGARRRNREAQQRFRDRLRDGLEDDSD